MTARFFGEYLVCQKALTYEQLEAALAFQAKNNRLLGDLAIQRGLMTPRQVDRVLYLQATTNARFGQLAVAEKFITAAQSEELLLLQTENHVYLGEALVQLNFLSGAKTNQYLNRFTREMRKQNIRLSHQLEAVPESRILGVILDIVETYFYRCGLMLKTDQLVTNGERPHNGTLLNFFACLNVEQMDYCVGLMLPADALGHLLWDNRGEMNGFNISEEQCERFEQIVFNIIYIISRELKRKGYKAKHGPAGPPPAEDQPLAVVRLVTVFNAGVYLAVYRC